MTGFRFDQAEFRERAATRLLKDVPRAVARSDDDLNRGHELVDPSAPRRAAAVLVPVVMHEPELTVLFTQRTDNLPSHAGQVAFPGGKVDSNDKDALAAALRETREETGLEQSYIEPLGFLDIYLTRTSFEIVPVVSLVRPGFILAPHEGEVAAIFEVPLRFLMSGENHVRHSREWQGQRRYFYAMPYGERYNWGATAGMIMNLYDRLYRMP
jgi:8-oxo-dGTP pyrophosphatase MutT (NUDIX family)